MNEEICSKENEHDKSVTIYSIFTNKRYECPACHGAGSITEQSPIHYSIQKCHICNGMGYLG
jgi:DnaJ-class molecular chaperone